MRYGFYLPTRGELANRASIAALARTGEAAERLFSFWPPGPWMKMSSDLAP